MFAQLRAHQNEVLPNSHHLNSKKCHCIDQLCKVLRGKSPEVLLPGSFLQFSAFGAMKLNTLSSRDILKFSEVLKLDDKLFHLHTYFISQT